MNREGSSLSSGWWTDWGRGYWLEIDVCDRGRFGLRSLENLGVREMECIFGIVENLYIFEV